MVHALTIVLTIKTARGIAAPLLVLMIAAVLTSCGPASETAPHVGTGNARAIPSGTLTLSGAITATVKAATHGDAAGCKVLTFTPPPPATTPIDTSLTGQLAFGSGATAMELQFSGAPTTLQLPLPGELTVPGPPGMLSISAAGATWLAGQDSPTSSGTLTLSQPTGGTIRGVVDATLAPLRGSSGALHVVGDWSC